jgi:hypothetical protein
MAQVADAGARICERVTVASLDLVDGLVALSSRQADVLMTGDADFESFWREESGLVQAWGSTLIDCARECSGLILATQSLLQVPGQAALELPATDSRSASPSRPSRALAAGERESVTSPPAVVREPAAGNAPGGESLEPTGLSLRDEPASGTAPSSRSPTGGMSLSPKNDDLGDSGAPGKRARPASARKPSRPD